MKQFFQIFLLLLKNAFATIICATTSGINIINIVRHKKLRGVNLMPKCLC